MKLRLLPLWLALVASLAHAASPGAPGTTTVVINGVPHVYDSTVYGVGADNAQLSKYKTLDKATPSSDAALASQYKMGASSSSTAKSQGTSIGTAWNQGRAPTTAGTAEDQALADRYINNPGSRTAIQNNPTTPSSGAMQSYTMDMLGVSNVASSPKPVTKSGAGAASFQSAQEAAYTCGTNRDFAVNGWTGKYTCETGGALTVRICPHAPGTVYCEDSELRAYSLANNAQVQESSLGLTMAVTFQTDTTFKLKFTTKATVAPVTQTLAQTASAGSSSTGGGAGNPNSTAGMLNKVSNSTNFSKALEGPGAAVASCQEKAQRGETCDGDIVNVDWVNAGGNKDECNKTVCLNQVTSKTDWTESCTRSFTRTNYACSFVRAPLSCVTSAKSIDVTYECEGNECAAVTAADVKARYANTTSCTYTKQSCVTRLGTTSCTQTWHCSVEGDAARKCDGGIVPTNEKGYILTGTSTREVAAAGGTRTEFVESWLGPDLATNQCTAAPYPLFGSVTTSCENQGNGKVRGPCEAWYGRTLTATACSATSTTGLPYDLDESKKAGCGYCARYSMLDSCLALMPTTDDSCAAARKAECSLSTSRCASASPAGSVPLCYAQEEIYACGKSTTACETWGKPAGCSASDGIAGGVAQEPTQQPAATGFTQAVIGLALLDASAKSANACVGGATGCVTPDDASKKMTATDAKSELADAMNKDDLAWYDAHGGQPKVFQGQANECVRTNAGTASINCCDIGLDRAQATQCGDIAVQLALARRNKFTHYVGEYCKQELNGTCISVAELYCSFEGLLQRVVQEQGRKQIDLSQAAYVGSDTTVYSSSMPYYGNGETGAWGWHQTKGDLHVYQWVWPSWCRDSVAAQAKMEAGSSGSCPAVPDVWFATCIESTDAAAASRCATPPANPFESKPGFSVVRADPLTDGVTSIHRQAWVQGSCDTTSSTCTYKVGMTTSGNRVVLTRETTFMSATGQEGPTPETGPLVSLGKTLIRPIIPAATKGTAQVTLQYSVNEGASWSSTSMAAFGGASAKIPGAENVEITLSCSGSANDTVPLPCKLKAVGTVVMTNKPWVRDASAVGTNKIDCSGFTADQFSMLDLDRMDLSEWTNATSYKLSVDPAQLPVILGAQVKQMTDTYYASSTNSVTLGSATTSSPSQAKTLSVVPDTGFGPFSAQLMVSGNWPEFYATPEQNTNPVTGVRIDWGDGDFGDAVAESSNGKVTRYTATHVFKAPTKNVVHDVKVTIVAKDGTHTLTKSVQNNFQQADNVIQPLNDTRVPGETLNNTGNQVTETIPGAATSKALTKP